MSDDIRHVHNAIAAVDRDWDRVMQATNIGQQASALVDFENSLFDLTTWHPDFDSKLGEIVSEPSD